MSNEKIDNTIVEHLVENGFTEHSATNFLWKIKGWIEHEQKTAHNPVDSVIQTKRHIVDGCESVFVSTELDDFHPGVWVFSHKSGNFGDAKIRFDTVEAREKFMISGTEGMSRRIADDYNNKRYLTHEQHEAVKDPSNTDAVALQMCRSAGVDEETAAALIWRIRGWIEANQRPGAHSRS